MSRSTLFFATAFLLLAVSLQAFGQVAGNRPAASRVDADEIVLKGPQKAGIPAKYRVTLGPGTVTLQIQLAASSYSTYVGIKIKNARGQEVFSHNTSAGSGPPKTESKRFRLAVQEELAVEIISDTNLQECRIKYSVSGTAPTGDPRPGPGAVARPTPERPTTAPIAGGARVGAELTASKFASGEFVNYSAKQSTSGKLEFKLVTLTPNADKVVWQVSDRRFPVGAGTDWESAKVLTSGETAFDGKTTNFQIDFQKFLGTVTEQAKVVHVRAIILKEGRLAARPSNDVIVTYGSSSAADVPEPVRPVKKPGVEAVVEIVAFKPRIDKGLGCNFILTKEPPSGELRTILKKINVTKVGQKFSLCESDYAYLKTFLTPAERAAVAWQDFLKILKAGYNWLDSKYNFIENTLVDALVKVGVDRSYARKAINYYKSIYGLNPSWGDFDESLDHGKEAFNAYLNNSSGDVPEDAKPYISDAFNSFVEHVRTQANGGGDPNQFFRANPDFVPQPFNVRLRVKYNAVNGATGSSIGGARQVRITVTSGRTIDKSTLNSSFSSGYQEYPPYLLAERTIELPNAKAGTTFEVPVYVDYQALRNADEYRWTQGFNSQEPGRVEAGQVRLNIVVNKRFPN
jgi:hypothetical protein